MFINMNETFVTYTLSFVLSCIIFLLIILSVTDQGFFFLGEGGGQRFQSLEHKNRARGNFPTSLDPQTFEIWLSEMTFSFNNLNILTHLPYLIKTVSFNNYNIYCIQEFLGNLCLIISANF